MARFADCVPPANEFGTTLRWRAGTTTVVRMRVAMMTREYPPEVYGGAGVHVTELVAQLRRLCEVDVHCMGAPRPGAFVHQPDPALKDANAALSTLSADLVMANAAAEATVVHSHTWYTGHGRPPGRAALRRPARCHRAFAGAATARGRPNNSAAATGCRRGSNGRRWRPPSAVIAVSAGMREDVLRVYPALDPNRVHVVKNGIDTEAWYPARPDPNRVRARPNWVSIRPADGRLRRADHPAEGGGAPGRRGASVRARGPAGVVRRRPRHPGDRGRGGGRGANSCPRRAPACSGCARCCRSRRFAKYSLRQLFSSARRCTSHWAS